MRRATVRDVAAEAGVCLATVDRVLNDRKGVRPATRERVVNAIDRLGFQRDTFAASLATGHQYNIVFILPEGRTNTFFVNLRQAVNEAVPQFAEQRIMLSVAAYKELDEADQLRALGEIDPQQCAGVAVVAIDSAMVREAIDRLVASGVPVVTLVSDVSPSRRLHCIGIDNVAAGRVAGSLIGRFTRGQQGEVALIAGSMTLRDHAERRLGFQQVMQPEYPHLQILPLLEGRDDSGVTEALVRKLLAERPNLVGIYNVGAGNRGLIEALEACGRAHSVVVVAHELTTHSRAALVSGTFDAVLHQDTADEVSGAVRALKAFSDRRFETTPPSIRIGIFFRDNLVEAPRTMDKFQPPLR